MTCGIVGPPSHNGGANCKPPQMLAAPNRRELHHFSQTATGLSADANDGTPSNPADGMTVDSSLVDRIVHGVLQQMRSPAPVKPPAQPATPPNPVPAKSGPEHRLAQAVITAGLVEEQVPRGTSALIVTPRAVITPAALDVLRARKLVVRRETAVRPDTAAVSRTLALVVRNTPAVERLCRQKPWRRELLGCPDDAAALAIASLSRGDCDRVLIFATQQHRAAVLANRNAAVKAVAVSSVDDLRAALEQIRVNVLCVDPTNRSDFEMTRLVEYFETHFKARA